MGTSRLTGLFPKLAAVAVLVLGGAGAWAFTTRGPDIQKRGSLYEVTDGAVAYRFDATWRTETLHDLARDPVARRDVARARAEDTSRLRGALLRHLGLRTLDEIPKEGAEELRVLRTLGYL